MTEETRGPHSVSCFVSGRWLRFSNAMRGPGGTAVMIDVMTLDVNGKDHKICELAVTLDDLEDVIEVCKGDAMRREIEKERERVRH